MRAVAQRVRCCTIRVGDERVGEMGQGLLALVGVARGDTPADAEQLASKLVHLRIFEDEQGRMNHSLLEAGGSLGIVSQFTLLGDCRRGRRPSYADAAPPEEAERLIELLLATARSLEVPLATGRFRAHMSVELTNDGPVTLLLDTRKVF
ncbi:MAG: D-aminoacyl-tRNA deacylase [Deltaproteobacteria bacterium]|nr:D-tyrosyl-tRNA(Tyr) deacylase [Myxococcales bacterium]MCZ6568800.1 D-aminoacyl-tRNA deacylase [Deltaproteobacteria bacterium]MCZ6822998.1 D-aminoacyl-tRNA deacylase [Deltaproteobacteria bacterium]